MHENHFRGVRSVPAVSRSGSFLLQHFRKASRSTDDVEMTKTSKILPFTPFQMMDFDQALEARSFESCDHSESFSLVKKGDQLLNSSTFQKAETILHQEDKRAVAVTTACFMTILDTILDYPPTSTSSHRIFRCWW